MKQKNEQTIFNDHNRSGRVVQTMTSTQHVCFFSGEFYHLPSINEPPYQLTTRPQGPKPCCYCYFVFWPKDGSWLPPFRFLGNVFWVMQNHCLCVFRILGFSNEIIDGTINTPQRVFEISGMWFLTLVSNTCLTVWLTVQMLQRDLHHSTYSDG